MRAALALPILAIPVRSGAAEVAEIGFSVLGYKERNLMKVTEPILWGRVPFGNGWEASAGVLIDIVTGASPQLVSNAGGKPVQVISGASINDRRLGRDFKLAKRFETFSLSASRAMSDEEDYRSRAFGLDAAWELNAKLTTLNAGYGRSLDRVRSSDNPSLDEPRDTHEYLVGVTQVLSPVSVVQSTLMHSRGEGWYNDPYKFTLTFTPGANPAVMADRRPDERNSWSWLTRYRHHFADAKGTLQADYRYFNDSWGVMAHTLEAAWERDLGAFPYCDGTWSVRPALRYYTQTAARFYSPVIPQPRPEILSSDQRLAAFGGLSPSLRVTVRRDDGITLEGSVGYYYNAGNLRLGGNGSSAYETFRAAYVLGTIAYSF